jgi:hypothetical protein
LKVCQVIADENTYNCLNLVLDSDGKIWDQDPPLDRKIAVHLHTKHLKEKTLQEIKEALPHVGLKEKRFLAVILANSLLHLYHSPWLKQIWSQEDISFFYYSEGNDLLFNLRQPYLSTKFYTQSDTTTKGHSQRMSHKFPSLLSLARVLLEIELSDRLEHIYHQSNFQDYLNSPSPNAIKLIVKHLLDEYNKHREPNPRFVKPIERCLEPNFLLRFTSLPNPYSQPDVIREIYVNIVGPLEQDLLGGFSQKGESLTREHLDALLSGKHTDLICNWKKPTQKHQKVSSRFENSNGKNVMESSVSNGALEIIAEEISPNDTDEETSDGHMNSLMADVFDSDSTTASQSEM